MISVIIPAYNEEKHIKTTIQRVWHYDTDNLVKEIIVVEWRKHGCHSNYSQVRRS